MSKGRGRSGKRKKTETGEEGESRVKKSTSKKGKSSSRKNKRRSASKLEAPEKLVLKNGVSEERKKTPRTRSKHRKKREEKQPMDDNLNGVINNNKHLRHSDTVKRKASKV